MGITPTPSTSPGIGPHSCPRAPCVGHSGPGPMSRCSQGVVLCPSGIKPLGRGLEPAIASLSPAPGDKDSCHKVGLWCSGFPVKHLHQELLCLLQNHITAGVCCR